MIAVFDIGGTSIKYGVMKPSMNTLEFAFEDEFASDVITLKGPGIVKKVIEHIQELSLKYTLVGVGISTAGMVDAKTGTIIYANENIPEYTGINLKKEIEKACGLPCWVENDVNAAAIGEASYGAGIDVNDIMMLTIGTGIGGAIILNGKVYTGHSNSAGEIGYMMINGKAFQDIASTTYLVNSVRRLCNEDHIDGKIIFERAKQNDEVCKKEIDTLCDYLVQGITNCICLLNSQKIVLGGGIMAQEKYLSPIIHHYADLYINEEMKKHTTIEFAKLGNLAGMAGAGMNFLEREGYKHA